MQENYWLPFRQFSAINSIGPLSAMQFYHGHCLSFPVYQANQGPLVSKENLRKAAPIANLYGK